MCVSNLLFFNYIFYRKLFFVFFDLALYSKKLVFFDLELQTENLIFFTWYCAPYSIFIHRYDMFIMGFSIIYVLHNVTDLTKSTV